MGERVFAWVIFAPCCGLMETMLPPRTGAGPRALVSMVPRVVPAAVACADCGVCDAIFPALPSVLLLSPQAAVANTSAGRAARTTDRSRITARR